MLRLELLQGLDLVWSLLITWRGGTLSLTFLPCVCLRRRRSSLVQLLWCKFSKKSQPRFGLEGSYRPAVSPPPSHSCSTDSPSAFDCIAASIRMKWNRFIALQRSTAAALSRKSWNLKLGGIRQIFGMATAITALHGNSTDSNIFPHSWHLTVSFCVLV